MWVLIWAIFTTGDVATGSAEFKTNGRCEAARAHIVASVPLDIRNTVKCFRR